MIFNKKKRRYKELQAKAKRIVDVEEFFENYDESGVGDLMFRGFELRGKSRHIIPDYIESWYYDRHDLDDWYQYEKLRKKAELVDVALNGNLAKYGMSDFSTPFIYKVDDQYKKLKDKPVELVKRFFNLNKLKRDKSFCSKFFGTTKADVNYHACRRVLVENGKLENR